jgi:membrane-bound metal-dependent hydrolase YbcI (DUF457 family)
MKFSVTSLLFSVSTIFFSIKINLSILNDYLNSDGKTQAFYAFLELKYLYKYLLLIISFIALFFIILAYLKKENKNTKSVGLIFLMLGVISIILPIWKYFIWQYNY